MRDDRGVAGALRGLHGLEGLGEGANLVDLHEQRVCRAQLDAATQAGGVGDKEVVANQLHARAKARRELTPAVPVLLGQAVLDGDDGVGRDKLVPVVDHLRAGERVALALEDVGAGCGVIELARGGIHGKDEVLARLEASLLDGLHEVLEGLGVGLEVGGKAALVAYAGGEARILEDALQGVVDLGRPAKSGVEVRRADGHDHELLEVHVVIGVNAAVQDVHHGRGQRVRVGAAQVGVKREPRGGSGCAGGCQAHAQDCVGAQLALVGGAVGGDKGRVNTALVAGVEAEDGLAGLIVHVGNGLLDALALVAGGVAVTKLDGLKLAGRGARGDDRPAKAAVGERDLCLDRGVAAGVQDLACVDLLDCAHDVPPFVWLSVAV